MQKVTDRLIILRALKYSESDLIIHALSPVRGRLNLIAKGALKSKKRFGGGVLQPTHFVDATFKYKGDTGEGQLHFLDEARLLNGFEGLRTDYDRLNLAFSFLQLVAKVTQESDPESQPIFDLLGNTLKALETTQRPELLKLLFEGKILLIQGVIPSDLPENDLFRLSVRDHEQSRIQEAPLAQLRGHIQFALKSYLD